MARKICFLILVLIFTCFAAYAEIVEMPDLVFEVPAGFTKLETNDPGIYSYVNSSTGEGVMGFCAYNDIDLNLQEATDLLINQEGIDPDVHVNRNYTKGQPISYVTGTTNGQKMQMVVAANANYIYSVIYIGADEYTWSNIIGSIKGTDLIGVGGYEIVSTQEYVRIPLHGLSYRIYTPAGRIDAETAMAIWEELNYKNIYEGYDLTSCWFYDMKSAAGNGMPYGQIMQDAIDQDVQYSEN